MATRENEMTELKVKYIEKTNEGIGAFGVDILFVNFLSNITFPFYDACKEIIRDGVS